VVDSLSKNFDGGLNAAFTATTNLTSQIKELDPEIQKSQCRFHSNNQSDFATKTAKQFLLSPSQCRFHSNNQSDHKWASSAPLQTRSLNAAFTATTNLTKWASSAPLQTRSLNAAFTATTNLT
jgi:hypothetical protein